MTAERVRLAIDGAVATLALSRPEAYNAIDAAMVEALGAAWRDIERDDDVRVVVIRGEGRGFSAGGDLPFFAAQGPRLKTAVDAMLGEAHAFLTALRATSKLVVTSVHGTAAGAGLSLAVAGDFCIAASDAAFVPSYLDIGVSPDFGGAANLVRAIGLRRAMHVYFVEKRIDAATAERLGIVNRVVDAAALDDETARFARALAALPAEAVTATKALLRDAATAPLAAQLDAELVAFQRCIHTPYVQDALQAFAKKAVNTRS